MSVATGFCNSLASSAPSALSDSWAWAVAGSPTSTSVVSTTIGAVCTTILQCPPRRAHPSINKPMAAIQLPATRTAIRAHCWWSDTTQAATSAMSTTERSQHTQQPQDPSTRLLHGHAIAHAMHQAKTDRQGRDRR